MNNFVDMDTLDSPGYSVCYLLPYSTMCNKSYYNSSPLVIYINVLLIVSYDEPAFFSAIFAPRDSHIAICLLVKDDQYMHWEKWELIPLSN